ncbi:MAG: hypothetical protein Q8O04_06690 [Deltaproteobacteria bacterium]|nr:hypothetical protein [Deltaproteobacteria bacterium]
MNKKHFLVLLVIGVIFSVSLTWAAEPAKMSQQEIGNDLAVKVPLKDIIKKAVGSGMDIGEAVAALINAGADPSVVVYIAITAGYSTKKVVRAALLAGAPLNAVVYAAVGAGADAKEMADGAIEAGIAPSAVASAIASATAPGATVFGYTPAAEAAPAVYTPLAPVLIGGGGGKVASPSKP